jgi:hypothetical protein
MKGSLHPRARYADESALPQHMTFDDDAAVKVRR